MRFGLLVLSCLVFASTVMAQEFCQSCNVVRETPIVSEETCAQPCICNLTEGEFYLTWNRRCIPYALEPDDPRDFDRETALAAIDRSFAQWTSVQCEGERVGFEVQRADEPAPNDLAEFRPEGGGQNTIVFADDWSMRVDGTGRAYSPNAFALTTVWFDSRTGEIYDADIELNEERWRWAVCPDGGCSGDAPPVDLENTLVHEIGHFFGFAHPGAGSEDSSLWACAGAGDVHQRTLTSTDQAGMCAVYGGALPSSCNFDAFNASAGCGCTVARRRDDGPKLFVVFGVLLLLVKRRIR